MQLAAKNITVEKQQCGEGLVLCRRGHLPARRERGEELHYFGLCHLLRGAPAVEREVAVNPSGVRPLRPPAVVACGHGFSYSLEDWQRRGRGFARRGARPGGAAFA